jgi:hypothetical protein
MLLPPPVLQAPRASSKRSAEASGRRILFTWSPSGFPGAVMMPAGRRAHINFIFTVE